MKLLLQSVGAYYRIQNAPSLAKLIPDIGQEVYLVREPENKFNPKAVKVVLDTKHIGYVPDNMLDKVWSLNNSGTSITCRVTKVYNPGGIFDGIEFELYAHGDLPHGAEYKYPTSISKFLSKYPSDATYLIKWAMDTFGDFKSYKDGLNELANAGTAMHDKIEAFLKGEADCEENVARFLHTLGDYKVLALEEIVNDDNLELSGRFDAFLEVNGKKILFDWKSSKSVQDKHKAQVAFYAKNMGADFACVVCFGAKNKQGYSVSKVNVDLWYKKVCLLKQFHDLK